MAGVNVARCLVCLHFLLGLAACESGVRERSLNGGGWTLQDSLGKLSKPIPATVPGQVQLDLMRAGIIGDPYANSNDMAYQWIGYDNWTYTGQVNITAEEISVGVIWLKFDGLDTVATISVNGKEVGRAENYHRRYKFDISSAAKAGSNSIRVDIQSPANYSSKQSAAYPYDLFSNSEPEQLLRYGNVPRHFVRKPQCDFGWDWGPDTMPSGIWGNVSMVVPTKTPSSSSLAVVTDVIPKTFYNATAKSYLVSVTACVEVSRISSGLTVKVSAQAPDIGSLEGTFGVYSTGETCGTVVGMETKAEKIEAGHLWWPLGVRWPQDSIKPNLVPVTSYIHVLYELDTVTSATVTKNVGFRNVELVQDPVGKDGLTFYFQLTTSTQKYPIYSKGSNFIPMDAFVNRATKETARRLLQSAVEGNQNMLRVWGGGLYQPDWFYDLCDEMGIMVWQEFMFADSLYPRDGKFLENVREEVRDVVRRLGNHPSIVLWSGNNENQGIIQHYTLRIVDYTVLYDETVRATLWEEDTTRVYWPASPSNGFLVDDKSMKLFIQRWGDVKNPNYGDLHRYDYDDYCLDVSKFPTPRFVSEFGLQSYPSSTSIKNISKSEDWSNDSPFMEQRNHHPNGNKQMENLIAFKFNLPVNDNSEYKFLDFIYLSQVIQAMCISYEAEHYRRMISKEGVLTRGTLYWQLNDIWQAQTWASVEWSGQWKMLHYYMRRTYAPILVSPYQMDDRLVVYVVLDVIDHEISYSLEVSAMSWKTGQSLNTIRVPDLSSKGFTGTLVYNKTLDTVFKGMSPKEGYVELKLIGSTATEILATNWHFPSNFTEVELPDATITPSEFKMEQKEEQYVITFKLSSNAVAPFVYLESTKYYGVFSDNGFLLHPDHPQDITFTTHREVNLQTFQKGLTMRSIKDTYSNKPYGHNYDRRSRVGRKSNRNKL